MVRYRRQRIPGGCFFFTVTLRDRRATWLTDHIDLLRDAMRITASRRPFRTEAIVILPEHLHTLWTLPPEDTDYPARWRAIKAHFTHGLVLRGAHLHKNRRGEFDLWQRRYWEHTIRDEDDFRHHVDYIHFNPVKHGWVTRVKDWPFSSFHRFVAQGILPEDWGGDMAFQAEGYGEQC